MFKLVWQMVALVSDRPGPGCSFGLFGLTQFLCLIGLAQGRASVSSAWRNSWVGSARLVDTVGLGFARSGHGSGSGLFCLAQILSLFGLAHGCSWVC